MWGRETGGGQKIDLLCAGLCPARKAAGELICREAKWPPKFISTQMSRLNFNIPEDGAHLWFKSPIVSTLTRRVLLMPYIWSLQRYRDRYLCCNGWASLPYSLQCLFSLGSWVPLASPQKGQYPHLVMHPSLLGLLAQLPCY